MTEYATLYLDHASTRSKDKMYAYVADAEGRRRSALWRFWTHKGDFYGAGLAPADTKLSLHASGNCRWAHSGPGYAGNPQADRAFLKWTRAMPCPDDRIECVAKVIFPGDHPSGPFDTPDQKDLALVSSMAPTGRAAILTVNRSRLAPGQINFPKHPEMKLLAARTTLGEWFYLTFSEHDFDQAALPAEMVFNSAKASAAERIAEQTDVTMALWCEPVDGCSACIELGAKLTPGEPVRVEPFGWINEV